MPALALTLIIALTLPCRADCPPGRGQHALLAADGANPDVFVFDSLERLERYVSGNWTSTKDIMQHTMLVPAGTSALIMQCRSSEARGEFSSGSADVFIVRLLSGPHANRSGWVIGADVHLERRPGSPPPAPARR